MELFTGTENKKGLFEEAHRGTILVDEIVIFTIETIKSFTRWIYKTYKK